MIKPLLYTTIIAFIALTTIASSQEWMQVACNQWSIDSYDGQLYHSVGEHGSILRSTDAGATWTQLTSHTRRTLAAVKHASGPLAIAVGDSGTIRRTTDGGYTWRIVRWTTDQHLRGVDNLGENFWLAVGFNGTVARSTNAGGGFDTIPSGITAHLNAIDIVDGETMIAVGDSGLVFTTADSGATWTRHPTGVSSTLRTVTFLNRNDGFVAGDNGVLLRTSDGGLTWNHITGHDVTTILSVAIPSRGSIIVGGITASNVPLRVSNDDGVTWNTIGNVAWYHLTNVVRDFHFRDAMNGIAVGNPALIAITSDAGATWQTKSHAPQHIPGSALPFRSAGFPSRTTALLGAGAVGGGVINLRTEDGGTTWLGHLVEQFTTITGIHFFDSINGLAITRSGYFLRSTNGGRSWRFDPQPQRTPAAGNYRSMIFLDRNNGFMVGDSVVFRTTDGGNNWNGTTINGFHLLTDVQFLDMRRGYVASYGNVFTTSDGGASWSEILNRKTNRANAIWFLDSMRGFSTGAVRKLHRTTDGGSTWDTVDIGHQVFLNDIIFLNDQLGYMVGDPGPFLLKTTDAGATWSRELPWPDDSSDNDIKLYRIDKAPDGRTVHAYGDGGILRAVFEQPFSGVGDHENVDRSGWNDGMCVRPNPIRNKSEIHIDIRDAYCNADARLTIVDVLGRDVLDITYRLRMTAMGNVSANVRLNGMSRGTYFIRFVSRDRVHTTAIRILD
ncbi:MAG: hypothetical protein H7X80_08075 [bacterium]|nr:hypothetical protein [Candidatus Kapabacteria bacterium]